MLRISIIESAENSSALRVEGQIVGPWTNELAQACELALSLRRPLTLDLGDVSLIDRAGVALLASLSWRFLKIERCSIFQKEQIRQALESISAVTLEELNARP